MSKEKEKEKEKEKKMTTNRYTMLLISVFVYLLIGFWVLAIFLGYFELNLKLYKWSLLLVLITYPMMVISATSYLLGRAIFVPKKSTVNKIFLIALLLLTCVVSVGLSYEILIIKRGMTVWQYSINAIIAVTMFIAFPMFLAKPNKSLLKLTAEAHKGF